MKSCYCLYFDAIHSGVWLLLCATYHVSCVVYLTLTVFHKRLAIPDVIPASALIPHTGVVRLCVFVLDPSRGGGDGDNVKNNGEEQQQGHDPPAARVGDPTAKHDRRSECVKRGNEKDKQR